MNITKIRDEVEILFNQDNEHGLRYAWFSSESNGYLHIKDGEENYSDTSGVRETWN